MFFLSLTEQLVDTVLKTFGFSVFRLLLVTEKGDGFGQKGDGLRHRFPKIGVFHLLSVSNHERNRSFWVDFDHSKSHIQRKIT